jgi:CheY-like chemotaxis protein
MTEPRPGKGNVLLVDDRPRDLTVLTAMLVEEGYGVTSAASGTLAI